MELDYILLDVFTEEALTGNPLAVFPHAAGLDVARMQAIAGELNLSETVFVTDADVAARRFTLRIMTPATELPFAGHPTVGTAVALARHFDLETPGSMTLIEGIGPVEVTLEATGAQTGRARFRAPALPAPVDPPVDRNAAARLLGLDPGSMAEPGPRAASAGVPFLFVPVASEAALAAARLVHAAWQDALAGTTAPHVYPYWLAAHDPVTVHARMFAPAMGITEDPATGAAAVAFARVLHDLLDPAVDAIEATIHQGEAMGRPARLALEIRRAGQRIEAVHLGGPAVIIGGGRLHLPA